MEKELEPLAWSPGSGLTDRRIVVTGAASGIGNAMLRASVAAGAKVVAVDINGPALDAACDGLGDKVVAVTADLASPDAPTKVIEAASAAFGGVDSLFHAAAVLRRQYDINSVTPDDFDLQTNVNQRGTWFLARDICEHIAGEGRTGSLVLFSSLGAFTGGLGGSWVYAATKGAVLTMVRGFAKQYAPAGIRVNGISPGVVRTPMLTDDLREGQVDEIVGDLVPLKRVAEPLELASAGLFLLSDYSSYVTGVTLDVDGGWNCR